MELLLTKRNELKIFSMALGRPRKKKITLAAGVFFGFANAFSFNPLAIASWNTILVC